MAEPRFMSMVPRTKCSEAKGSGIPGDVAEWIGAVQLIQATSNAVEQLPLSGCTGMDARNRSMLAMFAYGLARGIQDSRELEKRAVLEPALRHLCVGEPPTAGALRSFRRRHAPAIEKALTRVLGACWKECEESDDLFPALEAEAQARVRTSIWVDAVNDEN